MSQFIASAFSGITFPVVRLLAVEISKAGVVTPIAKRVPKYPPVLEELPSTKGRGPLQLKLPCTITFSPPTLQPALLSMEFAGWMPTYPFAELSFLNYNWPFGDTDLPYRGQNSTSVRKPDDAVTKYTLSADSLSWQNSPASPRKLALGNAAPFEYLYITMRVRDKGGSLVVVDADGTKHSFDAD
jgi:hypothetical protein